MPAKRQFGQPPARRNAPRGVCCRRLVEPAGPSRLDQRLATSPEAEELARPQRRHGRCRRCSDSARRHECVGNEKARARRIDSLDIDAYPDVPRHGVEREPAGVGDAEGDSALAASACRRRSARSGARRAVGRSTRRAVREGHPERDPIGRRRAHRRTRRVVASRRRSDWPRHAPGSTSSRVSRIRHTCTSPGSSGGGTVGLQAFGSRLNANPPSRELRARRRPGRRRRGAENLVVPVTRALRSSPRSSK